MQKREAVDIIVKCADQYRKNLENKNLLFIFGDKEKLQQFETVFLGRNYLHLTGIIPASGRFPSASDFYRTCIDHRLKESDFSFADNGTTEMKLSILVRLMNVHNTAKMVGEYNFTKSLLYTEKIAGNVFGCMGFIREDKYFIPNTVIKEDIRDITIKPQKRVLAIISKDILDLEYRNITYMAKGISLDMFATTDNIRIRKEPEEQNIVIKEDKRKPLDEQLREAKQQTKEKPAEKLNKNIKRDCPIR